MNLTRFKKQGGKWLGVARTWIQCRCINGERVTWNSNDILRPHLTVKNVEEIAGTAAFFAVSEEIQRIWDGIHLIADGIENGIKDNDELPGQVIATSLNTMLTSFKATRKIEDFYNKDNQAESALGKQFNIALEHIRRAIDLMPDGLTKTQIEKFYNDNK